MSEILQLAHFIQYNRMTQMQIRCSRIQPQLDAERFSRFFGTGEFLGKFGFDQEFVATTQCNRHRFPDGIGYRQLIGSRRRIFFVHFINL